MICSSHARASDNSVPKKSSLQRLCINIHKGEWKVALNGEADTQEPAETSADTAEHHSSSVLLIYVALDVCECVYSGWWVCKVSYLLTKRVNNERRRWLVPGVGVTTPIKSSGDPLFSNVTVACETMSSSVQNRHQLLGCDMSPPHVVSNMYEFISFAEHSRSYFEEPW